MKIVVYLIRFVLALVFIWAGIEKLFLPYDAAAFKSNNELADGSLFLFYDLMQNAGYMYFVGFFQLLCGLLLIFGRTHLLGAIMLVPIMLCMLMTQIFFSQYAAWIFFDCILFTLIIFLVVMGYPKWKGILAKTENTWI